MTGNQHDLTGQEFIIVGGAGYIGSHVCKIIAEHGGRAITFDNLSSGHRRAVRWGPLVNIDIRDHQKLLVEFAKYRNVNTVIHLASSIEVGRGETHPAEFYDNNVGGALSLLRAMHAAGTKRLIFSSTCATYGETTSMPLTEKTPQHPVSTYGKTKLAIEHMIESFATAYRLQYVTLRYFNAAGADSSGEIGEDHEPETHLIPNALAAAMGNGNALQLFGTDYDTDDGTCIRDYIHVSDIARAHLDCLRAFDGGLRAASVNIGTGHGISNLQILKTIEKVTGRAVPYKPAARRSGDLVRLYADPTLAAELLGFQPAHSDLENIIRTAWNYYRQKTQAR